MQFLDSALLVKSPCSMAESVLVTSIELAKSWCETNVLPINGSPRTTCGLYNDPHQTRKYASIWK